MDLEQCEGPAFQGPYTGRVLLELTRFLKRYISLFALAVVYRVWQLMCELRSRLAPRVKRAVHFCVSPLHDLGQRLLILTWHWTCKRTSHVKDVIRLFCPPPIPGCEKDMNGVLCLLALPDGLMSAWVISYKRLPPERAFTHGRPSWTPRKNPSGAELKAGVAATERFFTTLERTCKGHCPFKWKIWQLLDFGLIHLEVREAEVRNRSGDWKNLSPPPRVEPFDYSEIKAAQERNVNNERLDEDKIPLCQPPGCHDKSCIDLEPFCNKPCSSEVAEDARAVLDILADQDLIEQFANSPVGINRELESLLLFPEESIYPKSWGPGAWMDGDKITRRGMSFSGLSIQPKFSPRDPTTMFFRAAFLVLFIVVMWRVGSGDWGNAFSLGCFLLALKKFGP